MCCALSFPLDFYPFPLHNHHLFYASPIRSDVHHGGFLLLIQIVKPRHMMCACIQRTGIVLSCFFFFSFSLFHSSLSYSDMLPAQHSPGTHKEHGRAHTSREGYKPDAGNRNQATALCIQGLVVVFVLDIFLCSSFFLYSKGSRHLGIRNGMMVSNLCATCCFFSPPFPLFIDSGVSTTLTHSSSGYCPCIYISLSCCEVSVRIAEPVRPLMEK